MDQVTSPDRGRGFGRGILVTPTMNGWYMHRKGAEKPMQIINGFHAARPQPLGESDAAWRHHEDEIIPFYTHPSIGEDTEFQYPVPLLKRNQPNISSTSGRYSRHLCFETRRGSLGLGRIMSWYDIRSNDCLNAALAELVNENWAGAIRLLTSQLEELEHAQSGRKMDLIEVAAGQGEEEEDWPKVCDFVNKV
ncbi:heterokaryon incompatibility protein-domain-containing protein [Apiospora rasikravindrae]|uniref:Heterokaryon incompatibility protein-domain-containing protein n=1 Tax=Apiospora rasikravindrae TaxID=990691 RepID=A0ABR1TW77_9PEZI